MLNDFRQFRRMPVVLEDSAFYSALGQLYRDGKIILKVTDREVLCDSEGRSIAGSKR